MAFRDCMKEIANCARTLADDEFGRRLHTFVIRTRTWSGSSLGEGTSSVSDLTFTSAQTDPATPNTVSPRPRLLLPENMYTANQAGSFEDGDIVADRVNGTLTEAQLTGRPLAANVERYWVVDGDEYNVVRVEERYTFWRVHLRRRRGR